MIAGGVGAVFGGSIVVVTAGITGGNIVKLRCSSVVLEPFERLTSAEYVYTPAVKFCRLYVQSGVWLFVNVVTYITLLTVSVQLVAGLVTLMLTSAVFPVSVAPLSGAREEYVGGAVVFVTAWTPATVML